MLKRRNFAEVDIRNAFYDLLFFFFFFGISNYTFHLDDGVWSEVRDAVVQSTIGAYAGLRSFNRLVSTSWCQFRRENENATDTRSVGWRIFGAECFQRCPIPNSRGPRNREQKECRV